MDVWITECRKPVAKCSYCGEPIELGEPEVVGKLWRRKQKEGGGVRSWILSFRWHAKRKKDNQCCWLEAGLEHLRLNPKPETRGRKALVMPKEKRELRLKLLRKRARLVQILKELILAPLDQQDVDRIIRIGSQMEELKDQMADLGGVPKSWG